MHIDWMPNLRWYSILAQEIQFFRCMLNTLCELQVLVIYHALSSSGPKENENVGDIQVSLFSVRSSYTVCLSWMILVHTNKTPEPADA